MEYNFINPSGNQDDLTSAQKEKVASCLKLTSAIYDILDFLPEGEPLKNGIKEKSLAILGNLTLLFENQQWISLKDYFSFEKEKTIAQLLQDIEILENCLKLGKLQGWIDNVNFLILISEYGKIKSEIGQVKKDSIVKNRQQEISSYIQKERAPIGSGFKVKNEKDLSFQLRAVKKQDLSATKTTIRQGKILQILSGKEKAQVSDLIKELPNVTKRTIRRDLVGLLKIGKVIRLGEWNQVFYLISNRT